ncbi:hypothetical protein NP233_g4063 [Leucocoprinus birnbaumii]|uniref:Uncharacterized protein n=1 Tax=Leucocoprinus birnbaumii TaxID=56174 RepID=A0AAD5VY29_9AGAR|nr:hypothetical protein NP233_g4063 [Leucocoprinus birnbaumii]
MSTTFAHPPHPSELFLKKPTANLQPSTSQERNPHDVPIFDSKSLTEPVAPVLYLPPLLSSLPEKIDFQPEETQVDAEFPPLVTETRLPNIDPASLSLHKALHRFRPITPEYASTPYAGAFNWGELRLPEEEEREWYCVVFRSRRKAGSDGGSLYEADKLAHEEAIRNGGLIMYWYGIPHPQTGMNLATCIWQSRKHATAANSRPHHIRAMRLAAESYEVYDLERYRLSKRKGEAQVTIEPYTSGDVGW